MRKVMTLFLVTGLLAIVAGCSQKGAQPMDMGSDHSHMNMSGPSTRPMNMSMSYTCMMHPEVVSDKPGKCPKCGMDLMEKK